MGFMPLSIQLAYTVMKQEKPSVRNSDALSYASDPWTSSVDLIRMASGYSFIESPVKQNHSPKGARWLAAKLSIVFYLYSPDDVTCLALPTSYRLEIANFTYPPLI